MKFVRENYKNFYSRTPDQSSYGDPSWVARKIPEFRSSGTVLDLGAGDGRNAIHLAERGFDVTAVDLSEDGLAKLRRLAAARDVFVATEVVDLSDWLIPQMFDVMVIVQVFQHLKAPEALALASQMKELTYPNGLHAVSLFTRDGDRYLLDRDEDPDAFYPEDDWLIRFYGDWEIEDYRSDQGPLIGKYHLDGTQMTSTVEQILVRKPK